MFLPLEAPTPPAPVARSRSLDLSHLSRPLLALALVLGSAPTLAHAQDDADVPTPSPSDVNAPAEGVPVATPQPAPPAPPSSEISAPAPAVTTPLEPAVDVTVRGASKVQQMRESARAVDVIDVERDRRLTSDLGAVLARTEGVSVRRAGGLGSDARLSLNGLTDEQVRVFIDGVPLELAGYPFGVNNVPVELIRRIDIHRGVVPLRLGSDALGGAVELITDEGTRGTHAHASYQAGSFDTHRLVATARHYHPETGLFVRAEGFFDKTQNDYPIRVGQQTPLGFREITVRRNNDAYRAGSASVEAGVVQRSWARKLTVRGFFGDMDKGVPHDPAMQVPYGRIKAERRVAGTLVRYESVPLRGFQASATAGYNSRNNVLTDLSTCAYNWIGYCTVDRTPSRGERLFPSDSHVRQQSGLARVMLSQKIGSDHTLRVGLSPTFTRRTGEERALAPGSQDKLAGHRELTTFVGGLEYEANLFDERLQNLAFFKYYRMATDSRDLVNNVFLDVDRTHDRVGGGDALRFRFSDFLYAKVSYEYATRLPSPDQLFGDDPLQIQGNLRLAPESAHNVNLSTHLDLHTTRAGAFRGQVAFFTRRIDDLIFLFTRTSFRTNENVERATSNGVEGNAGWTSPGRWVSLDANATYQGYRNRARRGEFAEFRGQRILNQPYVFANGVAQLFGRGLVPDDDELSLAYRASYVHGFATGWEGANIGGVQQRVPAQLVHTLSISLLLHRDRTTISSALELHNLTNERVYDYIGVQLPGRTIAAKFSLGI